MNPLACGSLLRRERHTLGYAGMGELVSLQFGVEAVPHLATGIPKKVTLLGLPVKVRTFRWKCLCRELASPEKPRAPRRASQEPSVRA